jgi:hypothetical protein
MLRCSKHGLSTASLYPQRLTRNLFQLRKRSAQAMAMSLEYRLACHGGRFSNGCMKDDFAKLVNTLGRVAIGRPEVDSLFPPPPTPTSASIDLAVSLAKSGWLPEAKPTQEQQIQEWSDRHGFASHWDIVSGQLIVEMKQS